MRLPECRIGARTPEPRMTRRQTQLFRQARTRHGRRKHGVSLCEGVRCCGELLARRPDLLRVLVVEESVSGCVEVAALTTCAADLELTPEIVTPAALRALAATENPGGVCALFSSPPPLAEDGRPADPVVLILDGVCDPGNLGTILRTAWAVGLREVWLTHGSGDPFAPKAVRAGMGAQFGLLLRCVRDLPAARDVLGRYGYNTLWISVPRGGVDLFGEEFQAERSGLVVGSEAHGAGQCPGARHVSIPMPGAVESLNAAQAATLLLFEPLRRGLLPGAGLP